MSQYHAWHSTITCGRDENTSLSCERCREAFDREKSVCAFCCQPVDNKTFLGSTYHQTGKCRPKPFKVPKRTPLRRACNDPALGRVNYDKAMRSGTGGYGSSWKPYIPSIESYADLAKWWGLPTIGQGGD